MSVDKISVDERIVKLSDDTEVYIKDPSVADQRDSRAIYNKVFKSELESGAYLRDELEDILRERGLWNDKKQMDYTKLIQDLDAHEMKLSKGGIKLADAKKIALDIRGIRFRMRMLLADRAKFNSSTVEGQAENQQFNFLLSRSAVYNNNRDKTYFKSYEDYLNRSNDNDSVLIASKFAKVHYGTLGTEKDLPENQFLQRFHYVDDNLRLVNSDGHLVNMDGNLIDEEGRLIAYSNDGVAYFVDSDGNPLDDRGNYKFDDAVFLDDDGNPVGKTDSTADSSVKEKQTPQKSSRKRKDKTPVNKTPVSTTTTSETT